MTYDELIEPPIGSVILDAKGRAWQSIKSTKSWQGIGLNGVMLGLHTKYSWTDLMVEFGPIQVIHIADFDPFDDAALQRWWNEGNAPLGECVCDPFEGPPVTHRMWCRAQVEKD